MLVTRFPSRTHPFHDEPVCTQLREKAAKETAMWCVLATLNCNHLKSLYISRLSTDLHKNTLPKILMPLLHRLHFDSAMSRQARHWHPSFSVWCSSISGRALQHPVGPQYGGFETGTLLSPCVTSQGSLDNPDSDLLRLKCPQDSKVWLCGQNCSRSCHTPVCSSFTQILTPESYRELYSTGDEELALWLRALVALAVDQGLISNTHMAVHNHNSSVTVSSDVGAFHTHRWCRCTGKHTHKVRTCIQESFYGAMWHPFHQFWITS